MPVFSVVYPSRRLVCVQVQDPYTFEEWRDAMNHVLSHPGYAPGYAFLIDRRTATPPSPTVLHQMMEYAAARATRLRDNRIAVVVSPGNALAFGMSRMLEKLHTAREIPQTIQTFWTLTEAEGWLGQACPDIHGDPE